MSNSEISLTLEKFNDLHHNQNMSVVQIAEKYNTYPNKIRRLARKLGASIRNKSEAQSIAIQTGRHNHPTAGKKRSEDVKIKISESIATYWDNIDDEERERRSELAKQQWENMSEQEKADLLNKAHIGIRNAAKNGSKLEMAILESLIRFGLEVKCHQQHTIANEKMHLDMLIPKLRVVIEVDGPSHFQPIWGEDILEKSIQADRRKDGLLLSMGFCVIRIRQKKDLTKKLVRDILIELEDLITKIQKKFPSVGNRQFVIGE